MARHTSKTDNDSESEVESDASDIVVWYILTAQGLTGCQRDSRRYNEASMSS